MNWIVNKIVKLLEMETGQIAGLGLFIMIIAFAMMLFYTSVGLGDTIVGRVAGFALIAYIILAITIMLKVMEKLSSKRDNSDNT